MAIAAICREKSVSRDTIAEVFPVRLPHQGVGQQVGVFEQLIDRQPILTGAVAAQRVARLRDIGKAPVNAFQFALQGRQAMREPGRAFARGLRRAARIADLARDLGLASGCRFLGLGSPGDQRLGPCRFLARRLSRFGGVTPA